MEGPLTAVGGVAAIAIVPWLLTNRFSIATCRKLRSSVSALQL